MRRHPLGDPLAARSVRQQRRQPDPGARLPLRQRAEHEAGKKKAKSKQPTRKQLRALRYRPTEAVSAKVRDRMIEQLAWGEQAEQVRAQIGSGDLIRQWDTGLGQQGWAGDDLGNEYTFAYLQLWLFVNDKRSTTKAVDVALRKDLRRQLALDRKVGGAGDATQQETAEWLASWTVVLVGTGTYLRTLDDPARLEDFRDHARELIAAPDLLGTDLAKIRLTRRGIARR